MAAADNAVWGMAWSMDGSQLAVATADEVVQLWDVSTRDMVGTLTPHPGGALAVTFLSDGQTVATTSRDDGAVRLWDLETLTPLDGPLSGHADAAWQAVTLPDMRFATSSEDGTVRLWNVLDPARACDRAAGLLGMTPHNRYLGDEAALAC
jgi:WD40 repeat protein